MGKPKKKLSAYNLYMRKALKGKLTGKTKAQRKAIFKAAAKGWKRKSNPRPKPKSAGKPKRSSGRSSTKTGGRRMGNKGFNTNKIYGAIRKIAIFVPAASIAMMPIPLEEKLKIGQSWYFGWNPYTNRFEPENLWKGWGPAMGAQVVTRIPALINKLLGMFR